MIDQQPYIWYQLLDDSGSLGTQRYHVRRGTQPDTAHQAAASLRARLGVVSGCAFLEQWFVLPAVEVATPDPVAGVVAQRHAVFVFSTDTADQYAIIAVPGLRDELLMASGPGAGVLIDRDNPSVAAFVAELTSGRWCNRFGRVLVELEAAYLQVRDAIFVPDWLS